MARAKKAARVKRGKLWSELKPNTKRKYKAAGVTPSKYNAARSKRGEERRLYLGLRPHQISGASTPGGRGDDRTAIDWVYDAIERVFGDATYKGKPSFNAVRTRRWLGKISPAHVRLMYGKSDAKIYTWAFDPNTRFEDEDASTRNGAAGHSGGYLFYH